jgi:acyl-CoA synthetase (AMP-forming)/AMP-acid ligase II
MARVVDGEGIDVAKDGATHGQLLLKGDSVSSGYFEMPEETAAAHDNGWLRTGDVAVIDADGFITIVDRLKDVIISGGYNVAGGEVESALASHPAVMECAVVGRPHDRWGEAVHAFIVASPGSGLTSEALLAHVSGRLARYKQPRSFTFVEALPRNSTGKVLKRVLRAELISKEVGHVV